MIDRRMLLAQFLAAPAVLAETLRGTPSQTAGPFYPVDKPLDRDADLTRLAGRPKPAEGQIVHLSGQILDVNGQPVEGAKIEIWQANAHGRYSHPRDRSKAPLDPNFQGFGTQITDAKGRYRFKTVKPGAYEDRTPHIHVDIALPNRKLTTQIYFPGERLNAQDYILRSTPRGEVLIARAAQATEEVEPGALVLRWDAVLRN